MLSLEGLANLIFLAFIITLFYFLAIRPQKRRAEAHRQLVSEMGEGDEVVTIGGLYGIVRKIGDDVIELEVAPGTTVRFLKQAVARRITEDLSNDSDGSAAESATGGPEA